MAKDIQHVSVTISVDCAWINDLYSIISIVVAVLERMEILMEERFWGY